MNELTLRLKTTGDVAKACLDSILPEIDADIHERTTISLRYDRELVLHITARDIHALRAAANTYVRWLDMCVKLAK